MFSHSARRDTMVTFADVSRVIQSAKFRRAAEGFDRRPLIRCANAIGPKMLLLDWRNLEKLGRLPHFAEGVAEDAIAAIDRVGANIAEIFMLSHRWLRPSVDQNLSNPDDSNFSKARALLEFSKWRRDWGKREHSLVPEVFYWVDYSCFDQGDFRNNLVMLPLWVASCERILRFEVDDYHARAWCRLEILLSHTFAFADHQTAIGPGFRASSCHDGVRERSILQRPIEGTMTDNNDYDHIVELEKFTIQYDPVTTDRATGQPLPRAEFGKTSVTCFRL